MYYRDARRLYQHIGKEPGIAACHTGLGRLMLRLGFVDDALAELNQASEIYTQLENQERLEEVQEVIALVKEVKEKQHESTRFPLG